MSTSVRPETDPTLAPPSDDPTAPEVMADASRWSNRHGSGISCGVSVGSLQRDARVAGSVARETSAERLPGLRRDGPTERLAPPLLWGRYRLPVACS